MTNIDTSTEAVERLMDGVTQSLFSPPPPPRWTAANDTRRPTSGKDRSKVKAARKQRNKK